MKSFLCAAADLAESQSRGFVIHGLPLLAVRRGGQVFVYRNNCPHRNVRLEWEPDAFLDESASLIRCATHGALFLIESGECVAGPCAGRSLKAVRCEERENAVWVRL